jgi:hypothetical protein
MKKVLFGLFVISVIFSSCVVSRGHGCPDAQRMIGYGCFRGK